MMSFDFTGLRSLIMFIQDVLREKAESYDIEKEPPKPDGEQQREAMAEALY